MLAALLLQCTRSMRREVKALAVIPLHLTRLIFQLGPEDVVQMMMIHTNVHALASKFILGLHSDWSLIMAGRIQTLLVQSGTTANTRTEARSGSSTAT